MFWSYIPSIAPLVVFGIAALILARMFWICRTTPKMFPFTGYRPSGIMLLAHETLFDSMREGVIVLDDSNHAVQINPAAQRIIGAPHASQKSSWTGQPARQILAQWPELAVYLHSTSKEHNTVVRTTNEGQQRSYEVHITPLQTQATHCVGRLLIFHDTTEQERAAEALRQRKQQLRSMVRQLRELGRHKLDAAVQLHRDLSTSLTNLRFYLNLLERQQPDNHDRYLDMLNREVSALQHMVDELRAMATPKENDTGQTSHLHPITLNDVVDVALAGRRAHAEAANVTLEYVETASIVQTLGHFEQLVHAIGQLIENAIVHTPRGGRVWVKLYQDANGVCIHVQDTGPQRDMERLLQPDRPPHGRSRQHEQHGDAQDGHSSHKANRPLELAAESIRRLDGRIDADYQPGQGCTLTVYLPRLQTAQLTGAHRFKPAG